MSWGPERIAVSNAVLQVGRDPAASVHLCHPGVSPRHAELSRLADNRLWVRDLGSRPGVRVNGHRVQEHAIEDGDQVEFGPVAYRFTGDVLCLETIAGARLTARDLKVDRSGQTLLSGIHLEIESNKCIGILGPSGAGKSTLLKCLAGYYRPASGQIFWDGQELTDVDAYRDIVGYVPQQEFLYELLTGRENMEFALRLQSPGGLHGRKRPEEIDDILKALEIEKDADRPVARLSGGERKRFNVALGLLMRPRILFLDEPTSGLDPGMEKKLMRLLRRVAQWGTTVVCVTHVLENISLLDRAIVVARRTVVYSGSPAGILKHFNATTYFDVFDTLEKEAKSLPAASTTTGTVQGTGIPSQSGASSTDAQVTTRSRLSFGTQVITQLSRGLRLITRDRTFLFLMLLGQPVLIGLLIKLCLLYPGKLDPLFMFAVVTSIWLGLNNTAREVVRDRPIYVRERLAGVTPEGYLTSKILLFGLIGMIQVLLLVGVIRYVRIMQDPIMAQKLVEWPLHHVVVALWLTYLSGMVLGLLVSTLSKSQEVAVALLPLIVLPQLLLTRVVTTIADKNDTSLSSLVTLFQKKGDRGFWEWGRETISIPMYSRPSLALFREGPEITTFVRLVDWIHLVFLLLITTAILWTVFNRQSQRWLEQA